MPENEQLQFNPLPTDNNTINEQQQSNASYCKILIISGAVFAIIMIGIIVYFLLNIGSAIPAQPEKIQPQPVSSEQGITENQEENAPTETMSSISNNQLTQVYSEKITLCENIQIEESKDQCYSDYAQSRKNIALCNYIKNQEKQKKCKDYLDLKEPIITIYSLSSHPSAIAVGEKKKILFTVSQAGTLEKATVQVEQINEKGGVLRMVGMLNDNGENGDLQANDLIYGGTFTVGPYDTEQAVQYRAVFVFPDNTAQPMNTDAYLFYVTNFPVDSSPFDSSKVVDDPRNVGQIVSNEVLVGFNEGVSPDRIREIIKEIDGEVIGIIFGPNIYEIKISDTGDAAGVYRAIEILEKFSEVEYAEPNGITSIDMQ